MTVRNLSTSAMVKPSIERLCVCGKFEKRSDVVVVVGGSRHISICSIHFLTPTKKTKIQFVNGEFHIACLFKIYLLIDLIYVYFLADDFGSADIVAMAIIATILRLLNERSRAHSFVCTLTGIAQESIGKCLHFN